MLLRYCIKHRIPIPKNATKSIQIHDDQISLDVRIKGRAMPSAPMAAAVVAPVPPDRKRES